MIVWLRFGPSGGPFSAEGKATPDSSGIIVYQAGFDKRSPFGQWELQLPNDDATKALFRDGIVQDIVFLISYSADDPLSGRS